MRPPVIAISGRRESATLLYPTDRRTPPLELDMFFVAYAEQIARAGGVPLYAGRACDPRALVEAVDGILLSGGDDVDARRYGSVPRTPAPFDPYRDAWELALVEAAWEARRPLLGCCRGLQVLNVARGGTLVPDLPLGQGESHSAAYPVELRVHRVELVAGSIAAAVYGASTETNSMHHQAVEQIGDGLRVSGRAPDDVVETIEALDRPCLGVQWHPEFHDEDAAFGWLVTEAAAAARPAVTEAAR
jgi:putative glutamine amidotransferase